MAMGQMKSKDKDEGILGDGLAELARKQLRDRQARFDEILGDVPTEKAEVAKPKKATPVPAEKKRTGWI